MRRLGCLDNTVLLLCRRFTPALSLLACAGLAASLSAQQPAKSQVPSAGGVSVSEPRFRVMRSVSGTKGTEQGGRYVIEDPRTVFYIPEDKQVIVYFEWEGPTGPHTFEALWKNPEGKVSVISEFKYDAKEKRFGGYWSLVTSDSMPTGVWTLEARIDGEAAGTYPLQILAAARPADAIPARRVLMPREIYQRALAATVTVEQFGPTGDRVGLGTGFFVDDGILATTFHVIDGVSSLRIILPSGQRQEVHGVAAWSRKQDWALLRTSPGNANKLERGNAAPPTIGDRCFTLDAGTGVNRVLSETEITGNYTTPGVGERLNIAAWFESNTSGAPLLNQYGELIGIVGVSTIPGTQSAGLMGSGLSLSSQPRRGELVLPITVLPTVGPGTAVATLDDLMQKGELIRPLTAARHVLYGNLGRSLLRKEFPEVVDIRSEFAKGDQKAALLVMWDPKEKLKTTVALKVYDVENRLIGDGKPSKFNAGKNDRSYHTWEIPLTTLKPGIYRLDVMLGDDPAYRTFFRINE